MPQYSIRGRVRRIPLITEHKQLVFDVTKEIPDLAKLFKDDWNMEAEIICPPIVIMVLYRTVEEEDEREQ